MTDTSNQQIGSPPSSSNGSSSGSNSIELQSSTFSNRRSQRRRTVRGLKILLIIFFGLLQKNVQPQMRSSSLTTTILNENTCINECLLETTKENDHQDEEKHSSTIITDKLVFKTSKLNPKSSYWTVTDRQAEWYKLTIPVNQSTVNNTNQSSLKVPYRLLSNIIERKKSNSNLDDQNDEITYNIELRFFFVVVDPICKYLVIQLN